jgi:hypothetical protein
MNSRKIIEDCCKNLNLEIDNLSYERERTYIYGDNGLDGFWKLHLKNGDYYETDMGEDKNFAIEKLCHKLIEDYCCENTEESNES